MKNLETQPVSDPDLPQDDHALSQMLGKNKAAHVHPANFHHQFEKIEGGPDDPGVKKTSDGVSVYGADQV